MKSTWITFVLGSAVFLLLGCHTSRKLATAPISSTISGIGATNCDIASNASMRPLEITNNQVKVRESIMWEVNVENCQDQLLLIREGQAPVPFIGRAVFSATYDQPGQGIRERALINSVEIFSDPFDVVGVGNASASNELCQVSLGNLNLKLQYNQAGVRIGPPIVVPFFVRSVSQDPISVVAAESEGFDLVPAEVSQQIPSFAAVQSTLRFSIGVAGASGLTLTVRNSQGNQGKCFVTFEVGKEIVPQPSCRVVVDNSNPSVGQTVNARLLVEGPVTTANINGVRVNPPQFLSRIQATQAGTFPLTGYVGGPGGVGSCAGSYSVRNLPPQRVLSSLHMSTWAGAHIVGGRACGAYERPIGSFADCGGARCYGNNVLCSGERNVQPPYDNTPVVVATSATPPGARALGGGGCPAGFQRTGALADCLHGICNGIRDFCVKLQSYSSIPIGGRFADAVHMTQENSKIVGGGGCPAGFELAATFDDCGQAVCFGNQNVCIRYKTRRF